jgi:hypothetical protein
MAREESRSLFGRIGESFVEAAGTEVQIIRKYGFVRWGALMGLNQVPFLPGRVADRLAGIKIYPREVYSGLARQYFAGQGSNDNLRWFQTEQQHPMITKEQLARLKTQKAGLFRAAAASRNEAAFKVIRTQHSIQEALRRRSA